MNTDAIFLLSGYSFDEQGPYIILDDVSRSKPERTKRYVLSTTLTLRKLDERYCVGWYDLDTLESHPCPYRGELASGTTMCPQCRRISGFNPAFYNAEPHQISPQQRKYNEQPHVVYLAAFGAAVVKVGIACAHRARIRLLEQGARVATVICECTDAYEARAIEEAVSRSAGIPEVVRSDMKRRLLSQRFDYEEAKRDIDSAKSRIVSTLGIDICDKELVDFTEIYCGVNTVDPYIIDLTTHVPEMISGSVLGLIGNALLTGQGGKQFMLSLKKVLSHIVTVDADEEPNIYAPVSVQTSLF
jgi:hypothetical protein